MQDGTAADSVHNTSKVSLTYKWLVGPYSSCQQWHTKGTTASADNNNGTLDGPPSQLIIVVHWIAHQISCKHSIS